MPQFSGPEHLYYGYFLEKTDFLKVFYFGNWKSLFTIEKSFEDSTVASQKENIRA